MGRQLVIAIDGPAGAGKSSVARRIAAALDLRYVDTGAMYRAIGLRIAGADDPMAALARAGEEARAAVIETSWDPATLEARIDLDGDDVTEPVRSPEASLWASRVAADPAVRNVLVALQRAIGRDRGVVMEGRDIGTVVFPEADFKFFLDAEPACRAGRRQLEEGRPQAAVGRDLKERDQRDLSRSTAPLRPAQDALSIDTTTLGLDQVVELILSIVAAG